MNPSFKERDIILVGGPGGVGKTTIAAALGIELAREGFNTVVLTVDPARRLAQALGFERFYTELHQVSIPDSPQATLFASMLDPQHYFDKIIERFAKRPEQKEKILQNPLYRTMVDSLGGSHEYAAMERVLEFANDSRFQKIIVDTPPTQNAIDLLQAPQRLAEFMDNSVLRWFQGGKAYLRLFRTGTKLAMKMLQTIFGSNFMTSFGEFIDDLEGMQAGFRQRHLQVIELLRSERTAFLLVTYPSETRYLESMAFLRTLEEQKIDLRAVILNRVEPSCPEREAGTAIHDVLNYLHALHAEQKKWIDRFQHAIPSLDIRTIPRQEDDIHEVSALSQLGRLLVS